MTHPFDSIDREVAATLSASLEGQELGVDDAASLFEARGAELAALLHTADQLREQQAGSDVGYVVNRNVNFTNVCVKACRFCAFSRTSRSEQAYFLEPAEVIARVLEAQRYGATEVCLQAGLAPGLDGRYYIDLCRAVHEAAPGVHLHAFSPEEVKYGARLAALPVREYLLELRDAGLGSLPGTSAEVLSDPMRERISPGRITTGEWVEIISTAHELGIRTTSTLMYGHVESALDRARHMDLLRSIQRDTGGFTEFVPLSFVPDEAPMFRDKLLPELRGGPDADAVKRTYAIARLMLGASFTNVQVSWVKEGFELAGELLACGANDVGGTLMNESISTSAGASHGQLATPARLRQLIRQAGRVPVQRSTLYETLQRFDDAGDTAHPLDAIGDADAAFGSYAALADSDQHRFELRRKRRALPSAPQHAPPPQPKD